MKESSYGSNLASDIESGIGGQVIKISDRSTLGLPDYMHLYKGVTSFIETKIGEGEDYMDGLLYVMPWKSVKKDLRQFEVCKEMSKNALVLYAIYYPQAKRSLVLSIELIEQFRGESKWLSNQVYLRSGNGLSQIKMFEIQNREKLRVKINAGTGYRVPG